MIEMLPGAATVNFGAVRPEIDVLLQNGVVAYRTDRQRARGWFDAALEAAPGELPTYYCLYKIHTSMGNLDLAAEVATRGLGEAARQAGWPAEPDGWPRDQSAAQGPGRFAMFTLKALSFIELKRGHTEVTRRYLRLLAALDPAGGTGWPVIEALMEGVG